MKKMSAVCGGALVLAVAFSACVEPPPKIDAIPAGGLSLRVFAFGASAQEARSAFDAAKRNNKNLAIVHEGGDGELLIGLENDSPKCVAPTALCSFKVAIRVRDNQGKVLHASTQTASANAERCADLCTKALNGAVVKAIEAAAGVLKSSSGSDEAGAPDASEASVEGDAGADASVDAAADASAKAAVKKQAGKTTKAEASPPPTKEPAICEIGHGPHLPAEEAEKRAAQVEALKRIGILDQEEYDCLRKAYLDRL
jgi:hypothetical protein